MITSLIIIGAILLALFIYMQHPKFGKAPGGKRLEMLKKSPNFKEGEICE
jgi:hypothetical protein